MENLVDVFPFVFQRLGAFSKKPIDLQHLDRPSESKLCMGRQESNAVHRDFAQI